MEDKIEVGEYIRTTDGMFGIFDRYSSRKNTSLYKSVFNCFIKLQDRKTSLQCSREYIKNHSKNIIDLIEEDDYVNGYKVLRIVDIEGKDRKLFEIFKSGETKYCEIWSNEDIKSIVTKEQFNSIEYKFK